MRKMWESDIKSNPILCKKLILEYLHKCGVLKDYQSFNYSLDEFGNLILKNNIIYPYFLQSKKSYDKILK